MLRLVFDQVWCSKVEQKSSYDSWNMVKDPVQTSAILWQRPPKPYKLLIFSRLPWYSWKWANIVIFELVPSKLKMHGEFLQFNRKTEKYFKEFMRIERWICKIAVDPGHLLLLLLLFFFIEDGLKTTEDWNWPRVISAIVNF